MKVKYFPGKFCWQTPCFVAVYSNENNFLPAEYWKLDCQSICNGKGFCSHKCFAHDWNGKYEILDSERRESTKIFNFVLSFIPQHNSFTSTCLLGCPLLSIGDRDGAGIAECKTCTYLCLSDCQSARNPLEKKEEEKTKTRPVRVKVYEICVLFRFYKPAVSIFHAVIKTPELMRERERDIAESSSFRAFYLYKTATAYHVRWTHHARDT